MRQQQLADGTVVSWSDAELHYQAWIDARREYGTRIHADLARAYSHNPVAEVLL